MMVSKNYRITLAVSAVITALSGTILYLWITDELKFVGQQTDFTTAIVTEIKLRPLRNGFIQIVIYEFQFHENKYKGHFKGTTLTGEHKVKDLVRIKFSTRDPSISKRVVTLKKY